MTAMGRCDNCSGRLDRPGLHGCEDRRHPSPTLAQRVAAAIERDLNDRRGMRWDRIHEETRDAIRDRWAAMVEHELAK